MMAIRFSLSFDEAAGYAQNMKKLYLKI